MGTFGDGDGVMRGRLGMDSSLRGWMETKVGLHPVQVYLYSRVHT